MAKTKLISIRLDVTNIEAAKKLAEDMRYWTRSSVIDRILKCVFESADKETLVRMVRYWHNATKTPKITFQEDSQG